MVAEKMIFLQILPPFKKKRWWGGGWGWGGGVGSEL